MNAALKLPADYDILSPAERREARALYAEQQKGLCYHCKAPLREAPVMDKPINWRLFPGGEDFLRYPHHLHHSHDSGKTIGVVHAYCNAVLWQYHGE